MIYIGIAIVLGIMAGAIHNIVLIRHVMPYMKRRGLSPRGPLAVFQINRTVAEYYKTDDPAERRMKLLLRILKIPFMCTLLIGAFGIFLIWKAARGE